MICMNPNCKTLYCKGCTDNLLISQLKIQELRDNNDGKLPTYAWPGGYPVYYLAKDNGVLCPQCANDFTPERDNDEQLEPVEFDVHYEGPPIQCDNCYVFIESAYGDPDAEETNA
jgi:hypothetical protein